MPSRFSPVHIFGNLWTRARQASLSIAFFRQEYLSVFPCPLPGDLPDPGIKPGLLISPVLAGGFFTTSATWGTSYTLARLHNCRGLKNKVLFLAYAAGPSDIGWGIYFIFFFLWASRCQSICHVAHCWSNGKRRRKDDKACVDSCSFHSEIPLRCPM